MSNIKKAFKVKAGLRGAAYANGGMVKTCYADGGLVDDEPSMADKLAMSMRGAFDGDEDDGLVEGPGSGTSDSIKARLSDGEYVMPADTVAHIGVHNLDALKNATHTTVGLRSGFHFANGGLVDDEDTLAKKAALGIGGTAALGAGAYGASRIRDAFAPEPAAPVAPTRLAQPDLAADPAQAERLRGAPRATGVSPAGAPSPGAVPAGEPFVPPAESAGLRGAGFNKSFAPFDNAVNGVRDSFSQLGQDARGGWLGKTAGFLADKTGLTSLTNNVIAPTAKFIGGKVLPAAGAAYEGYNAVDAARNGDTLGAANHGVDAVASGALMSPAAPFAGAYLGGKAAGSLYYNTREPSTQDAIGGTLKNIANRFGFGDTTDDASYLQNRAAGAQPGLRAGAPAAQSAARPDPTAAFVQQYGGAAQRAADQLGVDPKLILAQWGNETGWGRHMIPGTNNLGNVKDLSGAGVAARDNMTGSNDRYRQFATPNDFADHYVGLMGRKYQGVQGAGSDVNQFTAGLKGYAEDPQYSAKIAAAYQKLGGVPGQGAPAQVAAAATPQSLRDAYDTVQQIRGSDVSYKHFKKGDPNDFGVETRTAEPPGPPDAFGKRVASTAQGLRDTFGLNVSPETFAHVLNSRESADNTAALREQNAAQHAQTQANALETQRRERQIQARLDNKDELDARRAADDQLQQDLKSRYTKNGVDGKPTIDADAVGRQSQRIGTAMASLGVKSWDKLDNLDRQRIFAASDLMDKVEKDADNWNPLTPGHLGTIDPTDLIGMTRLANDDGQLKNGKIIPARYLKKVGADRLGGTPTNEFDVLFNKKK